MASMIKSPTAWLLLPLLLLDVQHRPVHGHGYMDEPASRNYVAHIQGIDPGRPGVPGIPLAEYCPFCLNRNANICGISEQHGSGGAFGDYDQWLDSTLRQPMPWDSQSVYRQGDTILIRSNLWVHHGGHMEVRACPLGRDSTRDCLDQYVLTFVEDVAYRMPADPNYPERGYYYGGAGWNQNDFAMLFKLPDDLVGSQVLLQWKYITANSCSPVGYAEYFRANPELPGSFWNSNLSVCPAELPWDGSRDGNVAEQFFNCAEITVEASDDHSVGGGNNNDGNTGQDGVDNDRGSEDSPSIGKGSDDVASPASPDDRPVLVGFMGNWLRCPTIEQYRHYTHVMVAFAVSYRWQPGKNRCSTSCDIEMPPICEGPGARTIVEDLHNAGVEVLLSFGGAGMGGSWSASQDDCWEHCFGREDHVVDQLVNIVETLHLDGVDIDYEYFYEDNQRNSGFRRGREAQHFIRTLTQQLRLRLPEGNLVTHTPMDIDLLPGTAYYNIMKEVAGDVDFLMPQYYNGITRPVINGVDRPIPGTAYPSTAQHFETLANDIYNGDSSKVVVGFCINDCSGTGSNANGGQASKVMIDLSSSVGGSVGCPGGAFFWVASDDIGGAWSSEVERSMQSAEWVRNCRRNDGAPTQAPTAGPDDEAPSFDEEPPMADPTWEPTPSPVSGDSDSDGIGSPTPECKPCAGVSFGECQKSSDAFCWPYRDPATRECYPGTIDCGPRE